MKIPKIKKRFCPKCKKHTENSVFQSKSMGRSKTHPMSRGSKGRMRMRGLNRGYGNRGRMSKAAISAWSMTGAKTSKKVDLRFKCKECGKVFAQSQGFRVRRPEFK
ncbi:50S ribosomal protein L44e [Candidatus Woesearchaeota archaeon]|nr:50S ribosomal protein L44e [Candidatus Woesearchaeota archaeon]